MQLKLIEKKEINPGVKTFTFEPNEDLKWKPGQYLHYKLPHENEDDRGDERWFTISSAPFEKNPSITTRIVEESSSFKKALDHLSIGSTVEAEGPSGDFTIEETAMEHVFISGGIGITPFHSILKQADHDEVKLDVRLLYANRDENIVFKKELDDFSLRNPLLKTDYLIDPEHIDKDSIKKYVPNLESPIFYISGPEPMVRVVERMLKSIGVFDARIKLDDFPGYETI